MRCPLTSVCRACVAAVQVDSVTQLEDVQTECKQRVPYIITVAAPKEALECDDCTRCMACT
jgi:hypothetical protein